MADITYTLNQQDPRDIPGFENYSEADLSLVQQYQINNLFDPTKHFINVFVTDFEGNFILPSEGEIIVSENEIEDIFNRNNYTNYRLLGTAQSAGRQGASILTIDPIKDAQDLGYVGGVRLTYNFLNDLYTLDRTTTQFFISAISPDRTEIQLQNFNLDDNQILTYTSQIKDRLAAQSYFDGFRLYSTDNDFLIGVNIDTLVINGNQSVVVKLYEPLPDIYSERSTFSILEIISDPVVFDVDATVGLEEAPLNRLRPANFNLDITDNQVVPTQYFGYSDLFSFPINNTNSQLYSLVNERGIELSIDHTDYADFVHFSSAYERLANFKYKLQLVETYTNNITLIQTSPSQSIGTTGSVGYYENLITGVVNNFDHYERYLYYQSSSYAWPKSNSVQPYINYPSTSSQAVDWYANQLAMANFYDMNNGSILINTIPTYLRDDLDNENYLTFVHMIGQHFDNLWIYAKAVTDKYDADNRLTHGIPKDLVGEALKNFGVKLYTSNKSIENLFASFIGQGYQSGSEVVNTYVTGSVTGSNLPAEDISFNDYTKEVQKRIYHNLSHILKTKGTERGVRALINCFGIPSDILKIKIYGGRNTTERPYYGDFRYYTSSLDKIRLDHTGSIVPGNTISQYTSVIKRDQKYTDDLHRVEIGFSPVDNVDNLIISYSLATGSLSNFSIDDYIGDPRSLNSLDYGLLDPSGYTITSLRELTNQIMSSSAAYNVQDYVRLIKFFDNVVFKMVRDYVPGRSVTDTGIIIKPHLLQRNKAKSPLLSGSRPEYTGSVNTAFIESTDGETFGGRNNYITSYIAFVQTPTGPGEYFEYTNEQPRYNGEFSGSLIDPTNGELNEDNIYKEIITEGYDFGPILFVSESNEICLLRTASNTDPYIVTEITQNITAQDLFLFTRPATEYSTSSVENITGSGTPGNPYSTPTTTLFPFNLTGYGNYDEFYVSASSVDIIPQPCSKAVLIRLATCSLSLSTLGSQTTTVRQKTDENDVPSYNIEEWFNIHPLQTLVEYTASYNSTEEGISNPQDYDFTQPAGTPVTIKAVDPYSKNCSISLTVTVGQCTYQPIPTGSGTGPGLQYKHSAWVKPTNALAPGDLPTLSDGEEYGTSTYNQFTDFFNQNDSNAEVLNGSIFSTVAPVDPAIVFRPALIQRPRGTDVSVYGNPPDGYTVDPLKDRGFQSYFTPYCPIYSQNQYLPENLEFNVYGIYNDPGAEEVGLPIDLNDNSKYLHTLEHPEGTDQYVIKSVFNFTLNDPAVTNLYTFLATTIVGGGLIPPEDPDIAGPNNGLVQLKPYYWISPTINTLSIPDENGEQTIQEYSNELRASIRKRLPVAFHIVGVSAGVLQCEQPITIYPDFGGLAGLGDVITASGTTLTPLSKPLNQIPGATDNSGFIYVNKIVTPFSSVFGFGPPPPTQQLIVPIRKRG